ncbi:sensor histidine kinase [Companilactobacillus nodensis]|uniref:sensor histidine kinase n=1 Tax=Companilactobacillus nodensis TaxID=460870 RepID=UPI00046A55CF|nr:HAMP domain-containing sensor histidine kinase [Companilactobacillus nodensis]
MIVISFISILLVSILLVYILLLKKQIHKLSIEVNKMPTKSKYGSRFFVDFREKNLIGLVDELNSMIDKYESENIQIKRAEENLQLSITGLSHDLRTPLTAIDGYVQLLRTTTDVDKKSQYISIIEQSVSKLIEMTNQFYDLTRIDINQKGMNLDKISLSEIVQDNFLNFFDSFEKDGLNIEFAEDTPNITVMADKVLINRVIQNVIQNILRYAYERVNVDYEIKDKMGVLRITNDIKPGSRVSIEKVFDRFYTENQTRTNTESSGLGLYVSKRLIENMNGSMKAELDQQQFSIEIMLPRIGVVG